MPSYSRFESLVDTSKQVSPLTATQPSGDPDELSDTARTNRRVRALMGTVASTARVIPWTFTSLVGRSSAPQTDAHVHAPIRRTGQAMVDLDMLDSLR